MNYPNPFNNSTLLIYNLPKRAQVNISVHNILGQEIVVLFSGHREAGKHEIHWDASPYPSGTYFIRYQAGDYSMVNKCILLK